MVQTSTVKFTKLPGTYDSFEPTAQIAAIDYALRQVFQEEMFIRKLNWNTIVRYPKSTCGCFSCNASYEERRRKFLGIA